jgi:IS5 family transposase
MRQQLTLATVTFDKHMKQTRRAKLLAEMDQVVPWRELCALIEPYYPKAGNGRPLIGLERMLRLHFLQHWFDLSDPAAEEALYDSLSMRCLSASISGENRCPTRPPSSTSAACWRSTSWASGCLNG